VAEIPIQRKERRNIWPLLLGLIVLAAVLWFVFARRSNTSATAAVRTDSAAVAGGTGTRDSAGGATTNGVRADSVRR
jgi:LPXTG-motif cell wall-anchored protein